ncbi:hypothetical protein Tco_1027330 [Tanacetum coccineum]
MSTLQFANTHNLIAFLAKPAKSKGFEQVVDFLNAHTIKYALTINPTIYSSCIEQFWANVNVKTVNEEQQLQALLDAKKIVVIEASIRRDIQLDDEEGTDCLPNATILKNLQEWAQEEMGEGSAMPTDPHYTPIITQPSSSQPQRKQKSRRPKEKDTQVPQFSVPSDPTNVADEAVNKEPKISLVDETQGRYGDEDMFEVNDLDSDEVVVESEVTDKAGEKRNIVEEAVAVTDAVTIPVSAAIITNVELTLAQTLAELKSVRPKTKWVVMQEPSESTPTISLQLPSQIKFDAEEALRLQEKFDKEDRPAREKAQQVEEANIAWDDIQANIDVEYQLAERLQHKNNRKLFDKAFKRVNTFVDFKIELVEGTEMEESSKKAEVMEESFKRAKGSKIREERSSKRAGDELEQENAKKQKMDDDQEAAKMKELMKIFPDEEEVAVDAIPLATKPPSIID